MRERDRGLAAVDRRECCNATSPAGYPSSVHADGDVCDDPRRPDDFGLARGLYNRRIRTIYWATQFLEGESRLVDASPVVSFGGQRTSSIARTRQNAFLSDRL